jgi:hypothetical protein
MFNICACREDGRVPHLVWFVSEGVRPELRSRWSTQDSPGTAVAVHSGPCEDRNRPVTKTCETESIEACS